MDAYWRAANYLSVGQIYLYDNPLLLEPLKIEHMKPRLLGHWGTTPGQNFIYVHLNRLIVEHDLDMIYVMGPGHGGPGPVAQSYLEGSYTERYPSIERSRNGMERLFRQYLGSMPSKYYLGLRLSKARTQLQRTSKSVVQISLACGFASAAHFSNAYRERFGVTPREDRRNWIDKQTGAAASEPRPAALIERSDQSE